MKGKELTFKILLENGFMETDSECLELPVPVAEPLDTGDTEVYYRRLFMYYNYLDDRWSVWYLGGDRKKFLGYCRMVEGLNDILKKNNIDKEITIKEN